MGCCIGAEHSNWCAEDYDIVYVDAEGKEYCIFHAPADCKYVSKYVEGVGEKPELISGDDFNELVFARIDAVIDAGVDEERDKLRLFKWNPRCNFAGTIFFSDISFSGYNGNDGKYLPPIKFDNAQFRGSAYCISSQFRGSADFISSQFRGGGDFAEAESRKQIKFNDSVFSEIMSFDNMEFKGPVYFDKVKFEEPVSFGRTIFYDYSNFEKAEFHGAATFKHTLFKEWTYFRNVTFDGKTSFAGTISKETILIEATDLSNMSFFETNIESFKFIECDWDTGEDGVNLVYDEAKQDVFGPKNSTLEEIYRRLKKVARENADEVQTSAWHYKEKEMKKREVDSAFFFPTILTTILTAFAFLICCGLFKSSAPLFSLIVLGFTAFWGPYLLIQSQFKKFKIKYEDKPTSKDWFSKVYLNVYYWISGYGEKPFHAGVLLVLLILIPYVLNFFAGFKANDDWLKNAMWYMPLLKVVFCKGTDFSGLQYLLKGISVSLITIQAALFAFALRNKLRR